MSLAVKTPKVKKENVSLPPDLADYSPRTIKASKVIIRYFPWLARALSDAESAIKAGSQAWRL